LQQEHDDVDRKIHLQQLVEMDKILTEAARAV
jgi:hypothetical protein